MENRTLPPDLAEFYDDGDELRARREFMVGRGYRFCNIPACNCNSWHGGHSEQRLNEIEDVIDESGIDRDGKTLREVVRNLVNRSSSPAPIAWLRDIDGTGSLHTCAEGDLGAIPVYTTAPPPPHGKLP